MGVVYVTVDDEADGQRIDNFLMRRLKGVPRQHVYRILRKGEVRVNGGRVKPTYRLAQHDEVRIPPVRRREEVPVRVAESTMDLVEGAITYEDSDIIVLDKPAGLAVHGGSSISSGVIEILRIARGDTKLELAHRIDRDTSGCLLVCKRRAVLVSVQSAFRDRQVHKVYEVFVAGQWSKRMRSVQSKLTRYTTSSGERRVRVDANGQSSRTDFMVLDHAPFATRLEAVLHTGRTHQIRVHCKSSGHPIIGDRKYGPDGSTGTRLCLHASRLAIPIGGEVMKFRAPVPADMEELWARLSDGERLD